jgi:hypothetical protein
VAPRYAVRRLDEVPTMAGGAKDPHWHALQHYFGFTAFGANVYVAKSDGDELVAGHDEAGSAQEELYVVTAGEARFVLDGEQFDAPAVSVVAVPDPSVRRAATARSAGTTIVAIGGERQTAFHSSWQPHHFENAPKL